MDWKLLEKAVGCPPLVAEIWAIPIEEALAHADALSAERTAAFLAQVGHESAGLTAVEEGLKYSAASLVTMWPKRFTPELALLCDRNPERIANIAYANRLGNGPPESGDGWRYRGRGLIQVTGKYNYEACSQALNHDFVEVPTDLAMPRWAALSAAWYWGSRNLNRYADSGEFELLTKKINGGLHGLDDRRRRWARAKAALGLPV